MPQLLTLMKRYRLLAAVVGLCLSSVAFAGYLWLGSLGAGSRVVEPACVKPTDPTAAGCIASFPVRLNTDVFGLAALSPSGDTLYALNQTEEVDAGRWSSQIVAWRTSDGAELWRHALQGYATSVAMSPHGDKIAAWASGGEHPILVLSLPGGDLISKTAPIELQSDVAFNADESEISLMKGAQKLAARLGPDDLTIAPPPTNDDRCSLRSVGSGHMGVVTSGDGKVAVLVIPDDPPTRASLVQPAISRETSVVLDAICDAPSLAILTTPSAWPGSVPVVASFSPDNKRLAVAYSVPDTKDYGGLIVEVRDFSEALQGRAASIHLIASFPIDGLYPNLGWSPDGQKLSVLYETTADRRLRRTETLENMQARIYSIPRPTQLPSASRAG